MPKLNEVFVNYFANLVCSISSNAILPGDFNIHMNTVTNPLMSDFSFGLCSFVTTNLLIFQLTLRAIFLILSVGVVPQNCITSDLLLMNKCFCCFLVFFTMMHYTVF